MKEGEEFQRLRAFSLDLETNVADAYQGRFEPATAPIAGVRAGIREIERELRDSRFRGMRRPRFIDFSPRQRVQIEP